MNKADSEILNQIREEIKEDLIKVHRTADDIIRSVRVRAEARIEELEYAIDGKYYPSIKYVEDLLDLADKKNILALKVGDIEFAKTPTPKQPQGQAQAKNESEAEMKERLQKQDEELLFNPMAGL